MKKAARGHPQTDLREHPVEGAEVVGYQLQHRAPAIQPGPASASASQVVTHRATQAETLQFPLSA